MNVNLMEATRLINTNGKKVKVQASKHSHQLLLWFGIVPVLVILVGQQ